VQAYINPEDYYTPESLLEALAADIKYKPQYCSHQICTMDSCPACEADAAEFSRQVFDNRNVVCVDGIVSW